MAANIEIECPCCQSTIVVDRLSGEVLMHTPKKTGASLSLDSMVSELAAKKDEMERRFEKNIASQKDRSRILEEKFKEAMQRADKSDKPVINPMDLD